MKKIVLLFALLTVGVLKAQIKLTGTVKNKVTGEPLPGAVIYLPDLKNGTMSKTDGTFELNNLPATKTLMQVKLIGYKALILAVDLSSSPYLDLEMEESATEANEVVVTGISKAT